METDLNLIRSVVTALSLLLFVGICAWAFSRGRRERFEQAALLPFGSDGE